MKSIYLLFFMAIPLRLFPQDTILLKPQSYLDSVVISAARRGTELRTSPGSIYSLSQKEIRNNATGDIYSSLSTLSETDIVQLGGNVRVINTRGFNDAFQTRFVQLLNGMDAQLPALNITTGNLTGPIPIDVKRVELIAGPSSAMFGANAFNGLLNTLTTNPLEEEKIIVQVKGGNREYIDMQGMINIKPFHNEKLGIKLGGAFNKMNDWPASDVHFNIYGKISAPLNVENNLKNYLTSTVLPATDSTFYLTALNYFDTSPGAYIGTTTVTAPGVKEQDLTDYETRSAKAVAGIFYQPKANMELSYQYNFSLGEQILQGTTRYSINAYSHLHDFNFRFDKLRLKLNYNSDEFFDSYNFLLTGNYMSRSNMPLYTDALVADYYESVYLSSRGFSLPVDSVQFAALFAGSRITAETAWWSAESDTFKNRLHEITTNPNSLKGSALLDKSRIFGSEISYSVPVDFLNIDVLGYFKYSRPVSYGTLFVDTLVHASDASVDGTIDKSLEYVKLYAYEGGGLIQLNKAFFQKKLDLWTSLRLDAHSNFKTQFSPRGGISVNLGAHSIRASYQSGFRNPTLQNQYIRLDLGQVLLLGNITGYSSLISLASFQAFGAQLAQGIFDTTLLSRNNIERLTQEQVKSIELGYRGQVSNFSFELTGYYNRYKNFIGNYRGFMVENAEDLSLAGIIDSIRSNKARLIQIPINFDEQVNTYGVSASATYNYSNKLILSTNYTYSNIQLPDNPAYIPGFNTPRHKCNIQAQINKIYKGLGASFLWRWTDKLDWQSSIGDGVISAQSSTDLALYYHFDQPSTRITMGCTNIFNTDLQYAIGAPTIGRFYYVSLLMEIALGKSKKDE